MKTDRTWHGVRLRQIEVALDPDGAVRRVRVPASWDDASAAALCALAPAAAGVVALPALARAWIAPLEAIAQAAGIEGLGDRLHALLLLRRGAPSPGVWLGQPEAVPAFVLNLAAFHDAVGFDLEGFEAAIDTAALALRLLTDGPCTVAMADLAGLLAALGLPYAGKPARDVGACLATLLRGRADAGLAGAQPDLLAAVPHWPTPPEFCAVPGLAQAAAGARLRALRHGGSTDGAAVLPPGAAEALLGCETGGIAPAFSPLGEHGLTRAARAWLAASGVGLETALAAALAGEPVFPAVRPADHQQMHDAVAPFLHAMPARPDAAPLPPAPAQREDLPARRRGYTQKAAIGGHRVFLRTGEYPDGRLGEIGIALPKENAATRGMADSLAVAVSLGLQHGVPLDRFVDALAHQRFAPAGAVEGDPAVDHASSVPDYVFRSLASSYLGRILPADAAPAPPPPAEAPLLPLDLPRGGRGAGLRLVAG